MSTSTTYGGYTAKAVDMSLVMKFNRDVEALRNLLAASDLQILAPGTNLKTYVNTCTLQDGTASECAAITASTYSTAASTKELTFKKWLKRTGIESIAKQGYEGAVIATDEQLLRDIQKAIRSTIVSGLGTGTGSATGTTVQETMAACWAAVENSFEDEEASPVYFANYNTIKDYLGSATISMQTQAGINYFENFMGIPGRLVLDSNVPDNYIYGTAKENLVIAAADMRNNGMDMTVDESGLIAVHHEQAYGNAAVETVAYTGLCVFPMYASRVIKAVVDPT